MQHDLGTLILRLEGEPGLPDDEVAHIVDIVEGAFPGRRTFAEARRRALGTSDELLRLVAEALPTWSIHITGHSVSVAGRWTCTIRETGVRDDDELIGVGKAETLPQAILAALLKIIDLRNSGA